MSVIFASWTEMSDDELQLQVYRVLCGLEMTLNGISGFVFLLFEPMRG